MSNELSNDELKDGNVEVSPSADVVTSTNECSNADVDINSNDADNKDGNNLDNNNLKDKENVDNKVVKEETKSEKSEEKGNIAKGNIAKGSGRKRVAVNPEISQWYICRVQTGREDSMVSELKASFNLLEKDGIDGKKYFTDFSIPKHKYVKYVNGKKVEKDVNAYPGYVFLKIKLTDKIILFLRSFFKMNGFGQILPEPIGDDVYKKMMDKVNDLSKNVGEVNFTIGQRVRVNSGSFASMEGNVYSVNKEERKLVISVMIFNCETKIDATFDQVMAINDNK